MNIMELGAIGELVGGLAVIGTLLYVGLQIRQSNQTNRAESVRAFMHDYNTFTYKLIDNEEVFRRAAFDFENLSSSEKTKAHWLGVALFNLGASDAIASPERDDPLAVFVDTQFAIMIKSPGYNRWWEILKEGSRAYASRYVDHIDRMASENLPDPARFMPWMVPESLPTKDA